MSKEELAKLKPPVKNFKDVKEPIKPLEFLRVPKIETRTYEQNAKFTLVEMFQLFNEELPKTVNPEDVVIDIQISHGYYDEIESLITISYQPPDIVVNPNYCKEVSEYEDNLVKYQEYQQKKAEYNVKFAVYQTERQRLEKQIKQDKEYKEFLRLQKKFGEKS